MTDFGGRSGLEPLEWLREEIEEVKDLWIKEKRSEDYWRSPLAAVASANDPLFERLREVVDPKHARPQDLLPQARSVVTFFLPFKPKIGEENSKKGTFAARSWAESYLATNTLIAAINTHLKERIEEKGYKASTTPATHNFDEKKLLSRWSHKHLAYIAGLGTFGLNHLLITQAGSCGRLGSLVTSMPLPPTDRPKGEWCLQKAGHRCHACILRCEFGALRESNYDRHRCYEQCLRNDAHYSALPLVDVCGKCTCGVPCSYRIPASS